MNRPSPEFLQKYFKYKKMMSDLTRIKIENLVRRGYPRNNAILQVKRIEEGRGTSRGYEESPETREIVMKIQIFFAKNPEFVDELMKWQVFTHKRGISPNNFFQMEPTNNNKSRKRNVLSELKSMPNKGAFPGGINYIEARNKWPKGRRTRRKN